MVESLEFIEKWALLWLTPPAVNVEFLVSRSQSRTRASSQLSLCCSEGSQVQVSIQRLRAQIDCLGFKMFKTYPVMQ